MEVVRKEESPIEGYLATFKFFDSKNRRLSIFGRVVEGLLEVTVLTLSTTPEVKERRIFSHANKRLQKVIVDVKYDVFSKRNGRAKYEEACLGSGGKCPGRVITMEIIDSRPRYTFLKWCNDNFFREQKEVVTITKTKYVRGNKYVFPDKKKKAVEIPLGVNENTNTETA